MSGQDRSAAYPSGRGVDPTPWPGEFMHAELCATRFGMDAECDCELRTADRFVCRREGHVPLLRVTRHNVAGAGATYITPCQRCGKLYEAPMPEAG
jgi:hypothetical protein